MKMMKKLVALMIAVAMTISFVAVEGTTVQAADVETATVTVLDKMTDFDKKAFVSFKKDFADPDGKLQYATASFEIKEAGIVRAKATIEDNGSGTLGRMGCDLDFYYDAACNNPIKDLDVDYSGGDDYAILDAGTYYVRFKAFSKYDSRYNYSQSVTIATVPGSKMVEIVQTVNNYKDITVTVNPTGIGSALTNLQCRAGSYAPDVVEDQSIWRICLFYSSDLWVGKTDHTIIYGGGNTFTIPKNGTYTVRYEATDGVNHYKYSTVITANGIDTTAPTVKGVKNKKKYKKAVTIKFSDKQSGIKKATLNGKKIKSGKKVKKKGSYTLNVWDKAGNKKTVKFTIKK